jgi:hypothetical protein
VAAIVKAQGNSTLSYASNELKTYLASIKLTADGQTIDVTTLGDTAKAVIADDTAWSIVADFYWDSTVDGILMPDALTPGTKRTLVYGHDDNVNVVTLTWTSNAEIQSISLDDSVGSMHKGTVTFALSGAPGRSSTSV